MGPSAIRVINWPGALLPVQGTDTKKCTITGAAATLAALIGGGFDYDGKTKVVQVAIEGAAVRMTPSGAAPTAAIGQPILPGQIVQLSLAEAAAAKWIPQGADATAQVTQYYF